MKRSQASTTAKVIAASTIFLANNPRTAKQVAPGAAALCKIFLSGNCGDRWLARSAALPLTRWIWTALEKMTLPGIMAHYWHRKRWIETRCRQALDQGVTRLVIIGAGFDTLGVRLANELPAIEVFEIDHPATQETKCSALAHSTSGLGAHLQNLHFIPVDLSKEALPAYLFADGKPSLWLAEGVLMYLSQPDIDRFLAAIHRCGCPQLRLVFSFMARWDDGSAGFRPRSWLVDRWLAWRQEPFTWAIAPESLREFLAQRGFELVEMALTQEFSTSATIGSSSGLDGEHLAVCRPRFKKLDHDNCSEALVGAKGQGNVLT